jgi:hypothetical protein
MKILEELLSKKLPTVTKAVSIHINSLLQGQWEEFREPIYKLIEILCSAPWDTVRVNAPKCLHALSSSLKKITTTQSVMKHDIESFVLPLFRSLVNDPSWRVRHSVCVNIHSVGEGYRKSCARRPSNPRYQGTFSSRYFAHC